MKKIKVMSIFGTRPEAIKMAPLVKELGKCPYIESKVCVTAQHREMLDQVLEYFKINADFDLNIMKTKQTLSGITNSIITGMEEIFNCYTPDLILVHGDTTTTFSSSLAAFNKQIKVGHVEAGLRSFDKYFPYPEEMNRKLTGTLADMHFAPTENSKANLLREGINEEDIFITGNTVIDAMDCTVQQNYIFKYDLLNSLDYNKKTIMVTAHRRENWGDGIKDICNGLKDVVRQNNDVQVIYLVHLNPIVKDMVEEILGGEERIYLLPPLDTSDTHNLMNRSYMIMTDSGGLQEEAPHLGKPVLVFRDVTERPEAVMCGTVKLVGTDYNKIVEEATTLIKDEKVYESMSKAVNPYGDGKASMRIVESILYKFNIKSIRPEEFSYKIKE